MKYNKHNSRAGNMIWNDNFKSTLTNHFEQLKIQSAQQINQQQQQTSDWPTMIQSTSSNSVNQMKHIQCTSYSESMKFKSNPINNFEQMEYSKQQQTPALSTKISPFRFKSAYGLPYFNCKYNA